MQHYFKNDVLVYMKKAKAMFIVLILLALAGGILAYRMKSASPIYICYTTDLSGDGHNCNLVYTDTTPFTEPGETMGIYYTVVDDTARCKEGIPCDSFTVVKKWDAGVK